MLAALRPASRVVRPAICLCEPAQPHEEGSGINDLHALDVAHFMEHLVTSEERIRAGGQGRSNDPGIIRVGNISTWLFSLCHDVRITSEEYIGLFKRAGVDAEFLLRYASELRRHPLVEQDFNVLFDESIEKVGTETAAESSCQPYIGVDEHPHR